MKNSLISRRTTSFLISFSLVFGSMLSGVGPFEAFVEKAFASQGSTTAYGLHTSVGDTSYGADGVPMNGGGVIPGGVMYNDIDYCVTGMHPSFGCLEDFRGVINQGGNLYSSGHHFYDHVWCGKVYNGDVAGWYAPTLSTTTRWIDDNINCQVSLLTSQFPMPYGHDYQYHPEQSTFLLSMLYPELASGDKYVNVAFWSVLTGGEGRISTIPQVGQIIPLHRYFVNDLPYALCYRLYPTKEEAEAAGPYDNTVYSDSSPIGSGVRNSVGMFGAAEGGDRATREGALFGEREEIPAYSYTVAKVDDAKFLGSINPVNWTYDVIDGKVINVYPTGSSRKFSISREYTTSDIRIILNTIISRTEMIDTTEEITIDYYSASANRVSENEVKKKDKVSPGNLYQFASSIEADGETVYVDEWKVLGMPTAENPVLSLKVNKEYVVHDASHELEYTSIDSTYHRMRCKEEGCVYEKLREKHTLGDWVIDTEATETSNGLRHKKCKYCDYATAPEVYGILKDNEVDLADIYRKYKDAQKSGTNPTVDEPIYVNSDTELVMSQEFVDLMDTEVSWYANYFRFCLYKDRTKYYGDGVPNDIIGLWEGRNPDTRYAARTYADRSIDNNNDDSKGSWISVGKKIPLGSFIDAYFDYFNTSSLGQGKTAPVEWYNGVKNKQWEIVYQQYGGDSDQTWYISAVPTDQPKPGEEVPEHEHHFACREIDNDDENHLRYCLKDDKAVQVSGDSVCGFNEVEEPHNYGDWQKGTIANGHEGKHFRVCAVCGHIEEKDHEVLSENGVDKYQYIGKPALGNSASDDRHIKSCIVCGATYGEEACTFGEGKITKAPTHKETGEKTWTCTKCQHEKTAVIAKQDHTWSDSWSSDDDYHWHKCTSENCASDENVYKDKAAHSFTDLSQLTDASKKDDYHSATCSVCGKTIEQAHTWVKDGTKSKTSTCTVAGKNVYKCDCGAEKEEPLSLAAHNYKEQVTKEPTCSEDGTMSQVCKVCGLSANDVPVPALGHDYVSAWSHDETDHWHECSRAIGDDTHPRDSIDAHQYEWKSDGTYHWQQCSVCEYVNESSKTTHTYGNWSDGGNSGHTHSCTVCQHSETAAHSYNTDPDTDQTKTYDATCMETGLKTWTCTADNCDHVKTEVVRAKGHDFQTAWEKDANGHWHVCSRANGDPDHAKGSYSAHSMVTKYDDNDHWQECSVCGYNKDGAVTRTAHTAGSDWIKDGADHWHKCTDCDFRMDIAAHDVDPDEAWVSGNAISHYHICTICGGHADEEAHTYGDWTVTKEATENEAGSRERTCTVCGYLYRETIPALGRPVEEKKEDPNKPVPPPSNTITAETKNVVLVTKNAYSITGGMMPVAASGKKNANPYTVGNPKILKIDKNGKIKVKKAGTTTISFMTADGVTHTVTVTVEKPKKQNQTITDPNKTVLEAKSLVKGATYSEPDSVTSTKSNVATVDADGKIHIKGKGKTKIKYKFGKLKVNATLNVKVEPKAETQTAGGTSQENGTGSVSDAEDTIEVTIEEEGSDNYKVVEESTFEAPMEEAFDVADVIIN